MDLRSVSSTTSSRSLLSAAPLDADAAPRSVAVLRRSMHVLDAKTNEDITSAVDSFVEADLNCEKTIEKAKVPSAQCLCHCVFVCVRAFGTTANTHKTHTHTTE